jgi:hypothetical protein
MFVELSLCSLAPHSGKVLNVLHTLFCSLLTSDFQLKGVIKKIFFLRQDQFIFLLYLLKVSVLYIYFCIGLYNLKAIGSLHINYFYSVLLR